MIPGMKSSMKKRLIGLCMVAGVNLTPVLHTFLISCRADTLDSLSSVAVPVPSHSLGGPCQSMGGPVEVVPVPSHSMGDLSQTMEGPTTSHGSTRGLQRMGSPTISHTSGDPTRG